MRLFKSRVVLVPLFLLATVAIAAPFSFVAATAPVTVTCSAGGGTSTTLARGRYLMHVYGEDSTLCFAGTCAEDGQTFSQGFAAIIVQPATTAQTLSCRSAAGNGRVQYSKIQG